MDDNRDTAENNNGLIYLLTNVDIKRGNSVIRSSITVYGVATNSLLSKGAFPRRLPFIVTDFNYLTWK